MLSDVVVGVHAPAEPLFIPGGAEVLHRPDEILVVRNRW